MNKSVRQEQILRIIRAKRIFTQDDLAAELNGIGIPATQVTLSRDIRDLGLVKTADGYRELQVVEGGGDFASFLGEYVLDARVAQNLLVLHTSPGHASTVAVAIDDQEIGDVVGTIAGDDTILVIAPDAAAAQRLRERFLNDRPTGPG